MLRCWPSASALLAAAWLLACVQPGAPSRASPGPDGTVAPGPTTEDVRVSRVEYGVCSAAGRVLVVTGAGFGRERDTRTWAVGSGGVVRPIDVRLWRDTRIEAVLRGPLPLFADGAIVTFGMRREPGLWVAKIVRPWTACSANAQGAPAYSGRGTRIGDRLPAPPPERPTEGVSATYEPRQVVVVTSDLAGAVEMAAQAAELGFTVRRRQELGRLGFATSVLRTPEGISVEDALAQLRERFPELWVDANHRYTLQQDSAPVDARPVQFARKLVGWSNAQPECGEGQRIGMIDSAVDAKHPSLRDQDVLQRRVVTPGVASGPADHGTAVASLLVGRADSAPFAGLVPGASLLVADVFRQRRDGAIDTTAEWIAIALDWLVGQRAGVLNLSLGGPYNAFLDLALGRVLDSGVSLVSAGGNAGAEGGVAFPGSRTGVIAVTALDANTQIYPRASQGDEIEFAAPGVDLFVARAGGSGFYASGTSYAAPFVTAAVALERRFEDVGSQGDALQRLRATARDLGAPGHDRVFGHGLVQARTTCP